MTKKYNIQLKKNVEYPDVTSDIDMDDEHLFSLKNLQNSIKEQILEEYLSHPLFDANTGGYTDAKKRRIRRKARYIIKFPCEGNKSLSRDKYGKIADVFNRDCDNGNFEFARYLNDVPRDQVFLSDIFAGSKDDILKPDVTLEFEEIYKTRLYIKYNLSMEIELEINCNDKNMFVIKLDAFAQKTYNFGGQPFTSTTKTISFVVSSPSKGEDWSFVHTTYVYGIAQSITLSRVRTGAFNSVNKPLYRWVPNGNDPSMDSLLYDNEYGHYEPESIDSYEFPKFDDNGNTIIEPNTYPGNKELDILAIKTNNLLQTFLELRIKQLRHTLKQEIESLIFDWSRSGSLELQNKANYYNEALNLLDKCNTTIKVSSFEIGPPKDNKNGLFLSSKPKEPEYGSQVIIFTEKDIFDQFLNKNHLT